MRLYEIDKSIIDLDKLCCVTINDSSYGSNLILDFGCSKLSLYFTDKNLVQKEFEKLKNAWKQGESFVKDKQKDN